jgi:hypothetical protein
MTPFEKLLLIADEEVLIKVRDIIGKDELALMIVKSALEESSIDISATDASKVLKMPLSTVKDRISKIGFKKSVPGREI